MEEASLKYDDLDQKLSADARDVICQLVITWAMLDTVVTQFMLRAFGVSLDEGSILLGSMDTRTKLDRLKVLYTHHGMKEATASIAKLSSLRGRYVDIRNAVAHSVCLGHWRSDNNYLAFSAGKIARGRKGQLSTQLCPMSKMIEACDFATTVSIGLTEILETHRLRRSKPPTAPPMFALRPRPIPQKNERGRQG